MFTWGKGCKHTVFFVLRGQAAQRASSTEGRQHRGQAAQRASSTEGKGLSGQRALRALCTICSHGAQLHHQSILHNLFTVAHRSFARVFCTIRSQWHAAHSLRASCLP